MSLDFTTTGLLKNMKQRGFIPAGSGLDSSALLDVLSGQLRNYIPAFLKGLREEYLIATLSLAVTGPTVAAPARAVGAALRTVKWTGTDGTKRQLTRIEPERRQDYALSGPCPQAYMFEGNNLILVPAVSSGTLVLAYQQRPGQLVLPSAAVKLTGTASTDVLTVAAGSIPNSMTGGGAVNLDIVSGSGNFVARGLDLSVDSFTSTTITLGSPFPDGTTSGDYACLAGETCIPQLPIELHDLLAQAAAYQVASDTGSSRLPAITTALEQLRAQLTTILTPRNDGSPRIIVNRSRLGRRLW